jgi:hypothetical protein
VLQYVYEAGQTPTGKPPQVNTDRLERIARYVRAVHHPSMAEVLRPLDLAGEIGNCDAETGVRQVVDLYLAVHKILRQEALPQKAMAQLDQLERAFREDKSKHVLLRQFCVPLWGGIRVLIARIEAQRRATITLYALRLERLRTGRWPVSLRAVRSLTPLCRTDPFSGEDFIYVVRDDDMWLYSVGEDGKDHAGKRRTRSDDKTWDDVFWPLPDGQK